MPAVAKRTKGAERRERFLAIVADPGILGQICDEVAGGATLLDVAQKWDVAYGNIHAWVYDDNHPERVNAYARAQEARSSYIRDTVTKKLIQFANVDIRKCYDKKGKLLPVHKLPDEVVAAIQGIETVLNEKTGERTAKIKHVDQIGAISLLGRTQAMFQDKVDVKHSGTVGLADRLGKARARVINGTATIVKNEPAG